MAAKKGNQYAKGNPNGNKGAPVKYSQEFFEKLAKELLIWSEKPEAFFLKNFCANHKEHILPEYLSRWAEESEVFSQAYEKVKLKLQDRLYSGSITKKYDATSVFRLAPLIDQDYKLWLIQQANLEKANDKQDTEVHFYVHPDTLPDSK